MLHFFCRCVDPEVVLKWVSHAYGTLVTLVDGVPVRTTVGTHLEVGCVTQDLLIDWVCNVPCFWIMFVQLHGLRGGPQVGESHMVGSPFQWGASPDDRRDAFGGRVFFQFRHLCDTKLGYQSHNSVNCVLLLHGS